MHSQAEHGNEKIAGFDLGMLLKTIDIFLCGNSGKKFHGLTNVFDQSFNAEQRKILYDLLKQIEQGLLEDVPAQ